MTTVEEIFELLPRWLVELCEQALNLSGVKSYWSEPPYENVPDDVLKRGVEIVKDVCRVNKDRKNKLLGERWVRDNYTPAVDERFLAAFLGVSLVKRGMRVVSCDGVEWITDCYNDVWKFKRWNSDSGRYERETALFWLAKNFGIRTWKLLDVYYRWNYGDKKPLRSLLRKSKGITNAMLVEYLKNNGLLDEETETPKETPRVSVEGTTDIEKWTPAKPFGGNLTRIKSFFRDAKGYVDDNKAKGFREGKFVGMLFRERPLQKNVDAVKDELVRKGMDKAINRPRKGYGVDAKRKAYITEGVYTLTGSSNNSGTSKVVVARLSRFVGKTGAEAKRFAKGSEPIPFLLDQIAMKHGKLWVCEGVPDAVFVKNGIALNNWKPTELEQSIIDHYAKDRVGKRTMKGLRVAHITDNWVVGDKGGEKALDHYKRYAPETLMFDWTEFCSDFSVESKDLGELVMEMVKRGKDGFITADGDYNMPEELLERYTKPARDIHHSFAMTFDELYNESKNYEKIRYRK